MIRRNRLLSSKRSLEKIVSDSVRAGFEALDDRPQTGRRRDDDDKRKGHAVRGGELEIPSVEALRP